ncbi:insulin receptor substrate 1-like [Corythoichthys intestinalis]|uniref:insulin receptor substrate 1-like n=1 Tax=Corythoichthys intestinalis TaxID=161448 RepID=UPI0025A5FFA2|nr:insulin receptor substrate 1-like [Corythoichthys intestinalis]
MKEMVDEYNWRAACTGQACLATKPSCSYDQTQITSSEVDHVGVQVTPYESYEEFCSTQTSMCLVSTLLTFPGQRSDVVKEGYLGKLERSQRRYFVLRAGSHTGPSRLEWYKSQEKFTAIEKSSGKAPLFGPSKQGVIFLRCCIGVGCLSSSKKGLTVALYAQDQTMVLVADDQLDQEAWYQSLKKLMEERKEDDQACDDDDDGYCTLPPAAFFKEVWSVSAKPRGLGRSKSIAGELRLCLTSTSLILVRVGACGDLPSVTIPLLGVRRFGHLDGSFFLELGRSAPIGPGEIWFEARDEAQHIHEVVRDTVRALRGLPDFSRSPTSNNNQLLVSKRCRPKYRDRKNQIIPTGPLQCQQLNTAETRSPLSLCSINFPEPDRYMDMRKQPCDGECSAPDEGEGVGYMMMSPQASRSSCALPQDANVTMSSPQKEDRPASFGPHRGVGRWSSLYPSHQAYDQPQPTLTHTGNLPESFESPRSSKGCTKPLTIPFVQTAPLHLCLPQVEERLAVRSRLSSCLLSCLQADD